MGLASGLAAQIGYGIESAWGTPVTPSAFIPLLQESLDLDLGRLESEGIVAGKRVLLSEQWNGGPITVGGDVGHELYDRGMGKLLRLMLGGANTTGSGPYTHTFTPGDLPSATVSSLAGRPRRP